MKPQVLIVMGSDSDLPTMEDAEHILKKLRIPYEKTIASAHRTPERAQRLAAEAERKGIEVIIAGAGMAAHLAGVLAAHTILPVIGVPIDSSPLSGMDALLSTVQMPPGVPVATMAIGNPGARNAAILSAQIIARKNAVVAKRLRLLKKQMAAEVEKKDRSIRGT
jgi:phosphoribosylaminoimidazole carboxylase PurE protein